MELFRVTETYELELNKEWILMIPEFANILKGDKGSTGDSEGRKKLKAKKILAYIYFMIDFKSPIESWEYSKRHSEALRYTDLKEVDVATEKVQTAIKAYEHLQQESARSLKSLAAARKALDAIDKYFDNLDFNARDRMGKLVHSPKEVGASIEQLNKIYDSLEKFEKRVREQLKESTTIQGTKSLGDKEHKKDLTAQWAETGAEEIEEEHNSKQPLFTDLSVKMKEFMDTDVTYEEGEEEKMSTDEE
jgi:hypothetical protein